MAMLKVSRLENLTDGIFAIAMTILVLDLRLPPDIPAAHLPNVIMTVVFLKLLIYMGSFIILGTLWVAMCFQLGLLARVNRPYLWTNVYYLMAVCVVPFSASLLASYTDNPVSITFYAINLLCISFGQLLTSHCAHIYNLNNEMYSEKIRKAILQRIFVAPMFYVAAIFLARWDTPLAFITLIAPTLIYLIPGRVDRFDNQKK